MTPASRRVSPLAAVAILLGAAVVLCFGAVVVFTLLNAGNIRGGQAGRPATIRTTELSEVNVWRDYTDRSRGIVGTVRNGERVEFVRASGGGSLIRARGFEGWVNSDLVRVE